MKVGACSEIGKVRSMNEDHYAIYKLSSDVYVFVIADGMGGHHAGDVASKMAVDEVLGFLKENYHKMENSILDLIQNSIIYANEKIFSKSLEIEEYSEMGTTLTLGMIYKDMLYVGHIGDSRIYLIRNKEITQISRDHSLVAELVRNGKITEEEAQIYPYKNIITRALGTENNIKVDLFEEQLCDGDIVLLCTDGLTNLVNEHEISYICNEQSEDIINVPEKLVELANNRGGYDNITVIVAKYQIT
ncbi:MAG TPA: Stp1/IreP family PP2C-type Ser/Thr phosphatase [Thermoanaerobacterales bacterium]|nr:Stp1/IreP family PP2C-type Ser/Thr phosphatase [Thermoanaerobacterales bacterium]